MTGCYPWRVGQKPGVSIFANLKKNCTTLLEQLKQAGYTTCAVGRLDMITSGNWHDAKDISAVADHHLGVPTRGPGNYYKAVKGQPWLKNGKPFNRPTGIHSTDLISDFVVNFINGTRNSDKPFFVYMGHFAPHWPLQADEEHIAPYRAIYRGRLREALMRARLKRLVDAGLMPKGLSLHRSMLKAKDSGNIPASERMAIHAAMIEGIDRGLGLIVAALESAGQRDNTLILVLSDNGSSHQSSFSRPLRPGQRAGSVDTFINHGPAVAALNNTPFFNYKTTDYEGGIASPLVVNWPRGITRPGRITHRVSHITDLMPTCLNLAGVRYPEKYRNRKLIPLSGKSFVPTLMDKPHTDNRILVWPKAIRHGQWKLVLENKKSPELFHFATDRNETVNLAKKFPERVHALLKLHAQAHRR